MFACRLVNLLVFFKIRNLRRYVRLGKYWSWLNLVDDVYFWIVLSSASR